MRSQVTFLAILWIVGIIVVGGLSMHPSQVSAQGTRWEHYMAEGPKRIRTARKRMRRCFIWQRSRTCNAGPEDPRLAATLNTLAVLYHSQRKYAQAEPLYQRVLNSLSKPLAQTTHPGYDAEQPGGGVRSPRQVW